LPMHDWSNYIACKMGLQIPYCIFTQVSQEKAVREISETGW